MGIVAVSARAKHELWFLRASLSFGVCHCSTGTTTGTKADGPATRRLGIASRVHASLARALRDRNGFDDADVAAGREPEASRRRARRRRSRRPSGHLPFALSVPRPPD